MTRNVPSTTESDSPQSGINVSRRKRNASLVGIAGLVSLGALWMATRSSDSEPKATKTAASPIVASADDEPALGTPEPLRSGSDEIAAGLSSSDPATRRAAAGALAACGPEAKSAVAALNEAVHDADPIVRAYAAHALWKIDSDSTAVARLAGLLQADDDEVRRLAAYLLGNIGPAAQSAIPALRWEQQYNHGPLRLYAAEAIARIAPADRGAVDALLSGLGSGDAEQRALAAFALSNIAPAHVARVVPQLQARLNDEDLRVRTAAQTALSVLTGAASVEVPSPTAPAGLGAAPPPPDDSGPSVSMSESLRGNEFPRFFVSTTPPAALTASDCKDGSPRSATSSSTTSEPISSPTFGEPVGNSAFARLAEGSPRRKPWEHDRGPGLLAPAGATDSSDLTFRSQSRMAAADALPLPDETARDIRDSKTPTSDIILVQYEVPPGPAPPIRPPHATARPVPGITPIRHLQFRIDPACTGDQGETLMLPGDAAAQDLACDCPDAALARPHEGIAYQWAPTGLFHNPIYFQEAYLERAGYHFGCLQPAISGAIFLTNVATLPYQTGANSPHDCEYTLGQYRPGDCVPFQLRQCRPSLRGALYQTAAIFGIALLAN